MTWTLADVRVETVPGEQMVRAYVSPDAPGLAVHPAIENAALWTVTHVPSGRGVRAVSVDAENVFGFALQMARLGDWTRDAHAVWADIALGRATTRLIEQALASGEYEEIDRPQDPAVPPHARYTSPSSVV